MIRESYRTAYAMLMACDGMGATYALMAYGICFSPYSLPRMDCRDYNDAVKAGIVFG